MRVVHAEPHDRGGSDDHVRGLPRVPHPQTISETDAATIELNERLGSLPARAGNRIDLIDDYTASVEAMTTAVDQAEMLFDGDPVAQLRKVEDGYRAISRELRLEEWLARPKLAAYVDNALRLTAALQ